LSVILSLCLNNFRSGSSAACGAEAPLESRFLRNGNPEFDAGPRQSECENSALACGSLLPRTLARPPIWHTKNHSVSPLHKHRKRNQLSKDIHTDERSGKDNSQHTKCLDIKQIRRSWFLTTCRNCST
jgi:hypothetical protein